MRIARITVVLMLMALMLTSVAGCKVDIDWKESAKRIAIEWVKGEVITAIDKYGDQKEVAVKWVIENLNDVDSISSVTKWLPMDELVGAAWDFTWEWIYERARANGMDVDADDREPYAWHVSGADFAGVDSKLMALME